MTNENIFKAVKTNNINEVEKTLAEEKINTISYFGARSIVLAVEQENLEMLKLLLKNGEETNRDRFWRRTAFSALSSAKNAENKEIMDLLLKYGAGDDKKRTERIFKDNIAPSNLPKDYCYEDGVLILQKNSKDSLLSQYAKTNNAKKVSELLENGVSENAITSAIDSALSNNNWDIAIILSDFCKDKDIETYSECLKKSFLRAAYIGDIEKVKLYLEKLIENVVGIFTDESGKSTLEIALENNPADIIKILKNYGLNEKSLEYAYKSMIND